MDNRIEFYDPKEQSLPRRSLAKVTNLNRRSIAFILVVLVGLGLLAIGTEAHIMVVGPATDVVPSFITDLFNSLREFLGGLLP